MFAVAPPAASNSTLQAEEMTPVLILGSPCGHELAAVLPHASKGLCGPSAPLVGHSDLFLSVRLTNVSKD